MADSIRAGIIGGGWPGGQHAKGYTEAGGFKLVAVADLIPERRRHILTNYSPNAREFDDAYELIKDKDIDVVSVCLPTHLHAPVTLAALKAGKHVVCEKPPAMNAGEAKRIAKAAAKAKRIVMYAVQRRFGGAELAAKQAIAKGYAGDVYHARAAMMRTRGIPIGTGWFIEKSKAGGGAMIDLGVHFLDLAWYLLGQPKPLSVFGVAQQKFGDTIGADRVMDVEDAAIGMIRFEGGKSLEIATSWAMNQPPQQQGGLLRIFGVGGAVDVYTPQGAVIYRHFDNMGESKPTVLKPPRVTSHPALMRHLKDCIHGKATPLIGPSEGVQLMQMIDAFYKSAATGRSVDIK